MIQWISRPGVNIEVVFSGAALDMSKTVEERVEYFDRMESRLQSAYDLLTDTARRQRSVIGQLEAHPNPYSYMGRAADAEEARQIMLERQRQSMTQTGILSQKIVRLGLRAARLRDALTARLSIRPIGDVENIFVF
jgi:hypothetical protein